MEGKKKFKRGEKLFSKKIWRIYENQKIKRLVRNFGTKL
jgi:hypothetical protein